MLDTKCPACGASPVKVVYDETDAPRIDDPTVDIPTITFFCSSCRAVLGVQVDPEYVAQLTAIHVGKRITLDPNR